VLDILRRIYRAILTAVRWARRILDMVNQTLDSVLDIAAGAVEKVGAQFEQIMHRGMPVVIGFLADQVGLGGIGAAIRNVIDKLRDLVDRAILWLIDKIKAGLEALINMVQAGVAAVLDWWKARKAFRGADGQDHELFFEGTEQSAVMMIASRKQRVDRFLADYPDKESDKYLNAVRVYEQAKPIIFSTARQTAEDKQDRKALVEQELAKISAAFAALAPDPPEEQDYPPNTEVTGGKVRPTHNQIEHVSGTPIQGSEPQLQGQDSDTAGWREVHQAGLTDQSKHSDRWVQMHVVTAALGGKGDGTNLIPAPNSVNTGPFLQLELKTKQALATRQGPIRPVLWYDVKVAWHGGQQRNCASEIAGRAGLYVWKGKRNGKPEWKKNDTAFLSATASIPKPQLQLEGKVSLNHAGKTDLREVTGNATIAELIYQNRPYTTETDFVQRIVAAAERTRLDQATLPGQLRAIFRDDRVVVER
jgi:hypothetical protein